MGISPPGNVPDGIEITVIYVVMSEVKQIGSFLNLKDTTAFELYRDRIISCITEVYFDVTFTIEV